MNSTCKRAVAAAGALALTGGTVLAATVPASASAVVPAFPGAENYSYGVNADSFLLHADELALAQNEFGQHVEHVASFNLSSVVKGGAVVDTATDNGASSTIVKVNVLSSFAVLGLSARVVHSSCSNNRGTSGRAPPPPPPSSAAWSAWAASVSPSTPTRARTRRSTFPVASPSC